MKENKNIYENNYAENIDEIDLSLLTGSDLDDLEIDEDKAENIDLADTTTSLSKRQLNKEIKQIEKEEKAAAKKSAAGNTSSANTKASTTPKKQPKKGKKGAVDVSVLAGASGTSGKPKTPKNNPVIIPDDTEDTSGSAPVGPRYDYTEKPKKKSKAPVVIVVILLLILLAVGGFFVYRYLDNKDIAKANEEAKSSMVFEPKNGTIKVEYGEELDYTNGIPEKLRDEFITSPDININGFSIDTNSLGSQTVNVTLSKMDRRGNMAYVGKSFEVEIVDTSKPEITVEDEIEIEADDMKSLVSQIKVYDSAVGNYNYSSSGEVYTYEISIDGDIKTKGEYPVTITAHDASDDYTKEFTLIVTTTLENPNNVPDIKPGNNNNNNSSENKGTVAVKPVKPYYEYWDDEGNTYTQAQIDEMLKRGDNIVIIDTDQKK